MANLLKKNVLFVDAIGNVTVEANKPVIYGIMITPNAVDSRVTIKESASGTIVIDVKIENVETRYISFEAFLGIEVRSTFEITTLTNINTVLLYGSFRATTNTAR